MKKMLIRAFLCLVVCHPTFKITSPTEAVHQNASAAPILIANFDGPSPLADWYFYAGSGASGSLSLASGLSGQAAQLSCDLSLAAPGDAYVLAQHSLNPPLMAAAVSFWVKSSPGAWIKLWIQDSTDQTLQYPLSRPFSSPDPANWYQHVVELDPAPEYWGGANDGVFHGPIKSLSILAADLYQAHLVDSIRIDDIYLLDSQSYNVAFAAAVAVATPPGAEHLAPRLGVNIHFSSDDAALDAAKSAGFSFVRMDFPWADIELTKGVYTFTKYDQLVTSLETRQMGVLWIINQGNPLYTADWKTPATTTEQIRAFGNFAQAAAAHYAGRPVRWEVWNEPNLANFWPPAADPNQYAALAQETIERLHQGDPEAIVSTAGLSGFAYDFLRAYLNTGCCSQADAIGIHPYGVPTPEMVADYVLKMRPIVQQFVPADPPAWDTEWGYSSAAYGDGHSAEARFRQAVFVTRELLSAWVVDYPVMVYYDIRDDGTDPNDYEHNFGLLANDYRDKPAMTAVRTLNQVLQGRVLYGAPLTQPTTLHALSFDGVQDRVVAVWSDSPGNQVRVLLPSAATPVIDFLGNEVIPGVDSEGAFVIVREITGPIYITLSYPQVLYLPVVQR